MTKIHGVDRCLYKITALKNGKRVGSIKVIAYSKVDAYYSVTEFLPDHNTFEYKHLKFTDEPCGIIIEKNDKKRSKAKRYS